jgi:hypothetical protein
MVGPNPLPNRQVLGDRYCALLDEYLNKLRQQKTSTTSFSPYYVQPRSRMGQATAVDYKSLVEWAEAEKMRVVSTLEGKEESSGVKILL